jgi:hypothetical protein
MVHHLLLAYRAHPLGGVYLSRLHTDDDWL